MNMFANAIISNISKVHVPSTTPGMPAKLNYKCPLCDFVSEYKQSIKRHLDYRHHVRDSTLFASNGTINNNNISNNTNNSSNVPQASPNFVSSYPSSSNSLLPHSYSNSYATNNGYSDKSSLYNALLTSSSNYTEEGHLNVNDEEHRNHSSQEDLLDSISSKRLKLYINNGKNVQQTNLNKNCQIITSPSSSMNWQCDLCEAFFMSENAYDKHMKMVHNFNTTTATMFGTVAATTKKVGLNYNHISNNNNKNSEQIMNDMNKVGIIVAANAHSNHNIHDGPLSLINNMDNKCVEEPSSNITKCPICLQSLRDNDMEFLNHLKMHQSQLASRSSSMNPVPPLNHDENDERLLKQYTKLYQGNHRESYMANHDKNAVRDSIIIRKAANYTSQTNSNSTTSPFADRINRNREEESIFKYPPSNIVDNTDELLKSRTETTMLNSNENHSSSKLFEALVNNKKQSQQPTTNSCSPLLSTVSSTNLITIKNTPKLSPSPTNTLNIMMGSKRSDSRTYSGNSNNKSTTLQNQSIYNNNLFLHNNNNNNSNINKNRFYSDKSVSSNGNQNRIQNNVDDSSLPPSTKPLLNTTIEGNESTKNNQHYLHTFSTNKYLNNNNNNTNNLHAPPSNNFYYNATLSPTNFLSNENSLVLTDNIIKQTYSSMNNTVDDPLIDKPKSPEIKCNFCQFTTTNFDGLFQHQAIKHRINAAEFKDVTTLYKILCCPSPNTYIADTVRNSDSFVEKPYSNENSTLISCANTKPSPNVLSKLYHGNNKNNCNRSNTNIISKTTNIVGGDEQKNNEDSTIIIDNNDDNKMLSNNNETLAIYSKMYGTVVRSTPTPLLPYNTSSQFTYYTQAMKEMNSSLLEHENKALKPKDEIGSNDDINDKNSFISTNNVPLLKQYLQTNSISPHYNNNNHNSNKIEDSCITSPTCDPLPCNKITLYRCKTCNKYCDTSQGQMKLHEAKCHYRKGGGGGGNLQCNINNGNSNKIMLFEEVVGVIKKEESDDEINGNNDSSSIMDNLNETHLPHTNSGMIRDDGKAEMIETVKALFDSDRKRAHKITPQNKNAKSPYLFRCSVCDFKTVNPSTYERHRKRHHSTNLSYRCDTCTYSCNSFQGLNFHQTHHHHSNKMNKTTRSPCGGVIRSSSAQDYNSDTNMEDTVSVALSEDLHGFDEDEIHESLAGNNSFFNAILAQTITCIFRNANDEACKNLEFTRLNDFLHHIQMVHMEQIKSLDKIACAVCTISSLHFTSFEDYIMHMYISHSDDSKTVDKTEFTRKLRAYLLSITTRADNINTNININIENDSTHLLQKMATTPTRDKKKTPLVYRRVPAHEKDKHCGYCAYSTKWSCDLRMHYKNRHGVVQPYECIYCHLSFGYAINLRIHLKRVHATTRSELYQKVYGTLKKNQQQHQQTELNKIISSVDGNKMITDDNNTYHSIKKEPNDESMIEPPLDFTKNVSAQTSQTSQPQSVIVNNRVNRRTLRLKGASSHFTSSIVRNNLPPASMENIAIKTEQTCNDLTQQMTNDRSILGSDNLLPRDTVLVNSSSINTTSKLTLMGLKRSSDGHANYSETNLKTEKEEYHESKNNIFKRFKNAADVITPEYKRESPQKLSNEDNLLSRLENDDKTNSLASFYYYYLKSSLTGYTGDKEQNNGLLNNFGTNTESETRNEHHQHKNNNNAKNLSSNNTTKWKSPLSPDPNNTYEAYLNSIFNGKDNENTNSNNTTTHSNSLSKSLTSSSHKSQQQNKASNNWTDRENGNSSTPNKYGESMAQQKSNSGNNVSRKTGSPSSANTPGSSSAGKNVFGCPVCSYVSNCAAKIKLHIAVHASEKLYNCSECGKRSYWSWDISKHIKAKHLNNMNTPTASLKDSGGLGPHIVKSPQALKEIEELNKLPIRIMKRDEHGATVGLNGDPLLNTTCYYNTNSNSYGYNPSPDATASFLNSFAAYFQNQRAKQQHQQQNQDEQEIENNASNNNFFESTHETAHRSSSTTNSTDVKHTSTPDGGKVRKNQALNGHGTPYLSTLSGKGKLPHNDASKSYLDEKSLMANNFTNLSSILAAQTSSYFHNPLLVYKCKFCDFKHSSRWETENHVTEIHQFTLKSPCSAPPNDILSLDTRAIMPVVDNYYDRAVITGPSLPTGVVSGGGTDHLASMSQLLMNSGTVSSTNNNNSTNTLNNANIERLAHEKLAELSASENLNQDTLNALIMCTSGVAIGIKGNAANTPKGISINGNMNPPSSSLQQQQPQHQANPNVPLTTRKIIIPPLKKTVTNNLTTTAAGNPRTNVYPCSICPFISNKQSAYKRHMELHEFPPKMSPVAASQGANYNGPYFKCPFCPYYVPLKRMLWQHLRMHVPNPQEILNRLSAYDPNTDPNMNQANLSLSSTQTKDNKLPENQEMDNRITNDADDVKKQNTTSQSNGEVDAPLDKLLLTNNNIYQLYNLYIKQQNQHLDTIPKDAINNTNNYNKNEPKSLTSHNVRNIKKEQPENFDKTDGNNINIQKLPNLNNKPEFSIQDIYAQWFSPLSDTNAKSEIYSQSNTAKTTEEISLKNLTVTKYKQSRYVSPPLKTHYTNDKDNKDLSPTKNNQLYNEEEISKQFENTDRCVENSTNRNPINLFDQYWQQELPQKPAIIDSPEDFVDESLLDPPKQPPKPCTWNKDGLKDITVAWGLKNGRYTRMFKCPYCPHLGTRRANVRIHATLHGKRKGLKTKLQFCPNCTFNCANPTRFANHLKMHYAPNDNPTPEQNVNSLNGEASSLTYDEYKNDYEGTLNAINSPINPNEQMLSHSFKESNKVSVGMIKGLFNCPKCPANFVIKRVLSKHLRFHGRNYRHKCHHCDYSAAKITQITRHQKVHGKTDHYAKSTQNLTPLNAANVDIDQNNSEKQNLNGEENSEENEDSNLSDSEHELIIDN